MKLEQQVTSLEISKRLKELGVPQESLFWWEKMDIRGSISYVITNEDLNREQNQWDEVYASTFTVAELGEMLSKRGVYFSGKDSLESEYEWFCTQMSMPEFEYWQEEFVQANTEADARGAMLIYLLENKLITI